MWAKGKSRSKVVWVGKGVHLAEVGGKGCIQSKHTLQNFQRTSENEKKHIGGNKWSRRNEATFQKKKPFGPGLDTDFKAMVIKTVARVVEREVWVKGTEVSEPSSPIMLNPLHVAALKGAGSLFRQVVRE